MHKIDLLVSDYVEARQWSHKYEWNWYSVEVFNCDKSGF